VFEDERAILTDATSVEQGGQFVNAGNEYLASIVAHLDTSVLLSHRGQLHADIAPLGSAQQASLVDQREDGTVGARAPYDHDGAVEGHLEGPTHS